MNAQIFLTRVIDGFRRRKFLYILPAVLLGAVGLVLGLASNDYMAKGTMLVQEETFLSQLTEVRPDGSSFEQPSAVANEQLYVLLRTDSFMETVIDLSGAGDELGVGAQPTDEVYQLTRKAISSWPAGQNFLIISATWDDPDVAHDLTAGTIEALVQWRIAADQVASRSAEEFLAELVSTYQGEVDSSRSALETFVEANPAPIGVGLTRPDIEVVEIARLQLRVDTAEESLADARRKAEDARLATAQAESDGREALQVVDPPTPPESPETGLRKVAMQTALFGIVGLAASAAVLAVTAALDPTLRSPVEVERRLGLTVAAVLPAEQGEVAADSPRFTTEGKGSFEHVVPNETAEEIRRFVARRSPIANSSVFAVTAPTNDDGASSFARSLAAVLASDAGLSVGLVTLTGTAATTGGSQPRATSLDGLACIELPAQAEAFRSSVTNSPLLPFDLEELRLQFHVIVLELPPVAEDSSVPALSRLVDVLLVVRSAKTSLSSARRCIADIGTDRIAGVVLTGHRNPKIPKVLESISTER